MSRLASAFRRYWITFFCFVSTSRGRRDWKERGMEGGMEGGSEGERESGSARGRIQLEGGRMGELEMGDNHTNQ